MDGTKTIDILVRVTTTGEPASFVKAFRRELFVQYGSMAVAEVLTPLSSDPIHT